MTSKKHLLLLLSSSIFLSACTSPQTGTVQTPTSTGNTPEAQEKSLSTSMRELMSMGTSLQCKYSFTDPESKTETSGTMYISGSKFAQETEIKLPPESSAIGGKMNMISDGTSMYTWNPDKKDGGMKITIEKDSQVKDQDDNSQVDLDKKIDMKCSPWSVSESKFTVPADVKFTDLSQMMKNIQEQTRGIPAGIPSIPKNIPGVPEE